ncbi:MAG: hypothetical protein WBA29_15115 [Xanthobacteraceae bacterium]
MMRISSSATSTRWGERSQVIPPIAAALEAQPGAGGVGKVVDHVEADGLTAGAVERRLGSLGVGLGLIPNRLEAGDALFRHPVVLIDHTGLDGVKEPVDPLVGLGDPLVKFGEVFAATFRAVLAAFEKTGKDGLQPLGLEQAFLHVARHKIVELVHGDGATLAVGLALPGLGRAGVVAVQAASAALAGA